MSKDLEVKVYFGYRRHNNAYNNPLQRDWVGLDLGEGVTPDNILFNNVRKIIKKYISEWTGRGEIKINAVQVSSIWLETKKNKNVLKVNNQLFKNMAGKTYQFNN